MHTNQQKTSKFRSLNKWKSSGVILGIILSSLLFLGSISMVIILSIGINQSNTTSNNMLTLTMFAILIVVFLLFEIGATINIVYTVLYLFDKQNNTLFIAILNLIFAFGIPGYLILYGDKLENETVEV